MIFVLHGDDTASSYERLTSILDSYKDSLKVHLVKSTALQITEEALARDLIFPQKIVVVENFLSPFKKLPPDLFKNIPADATLIFWEKSTLTPAKLAKLEKLAKVELFKEKSLLFPFLDSMIPGSKASLVLLQSVKDTNGLPWQLQNRLLLLILSKLNFDLNRTVKITKRNIADWQWNKIKFQSAKFNLEKLIAMYQAALKIDLMVKNGKTNIPAETLISVLLLKYLAR